MSYASVFVIKELFMQWRPSTAKSKYRIAIRLTSLKNKKIMKQTYLITPWSIGCVQEVIFRDKNCELKAFSPETSEWAGQLSTIIKTFLPCILNLRSSSCNHSSKSVPSIHAFFWDQYLQGGYESAWNILDWQIFQCKTLESSHQGR